MNLSPRDFQFMTTVEEVVNWVRELADKLVRYEHLIQKQQTALEELRARVNQLENGKDYFARVKWLLRMPARLRKGLSAPPHQANLPPALAPVRSYQIAHQPDLIPSVELM